MIVEKIKNILSQDKRQKLVFYFDADGSFQEELKDIETAGIEIITVNQNYFDLKYKLEVLAKNEKRSLNNLIIYALDKYVQTEIDSIQNKME